MKSIMVTYPGFQALPRGLKMLLVASENFFFSEAHSRPVKTVSEKSKVRATLRPGQRPDLNEQFPAFGAAWRN